MKYLYILVILLVIFYIVKRNMDNYKNIEVENFDPSLVPVSSIVTLAKVAQKLVDGGGTLTNPGNLRITGNQQIDGTLNVNNAIFGNGGINAIANSPEGGRVSIVNSSKTGANQTKDWALWNMTGNYGNKLAFWRYNGDGSNPGPTLELNDDGTSQFNGNVNTTGNATITGDLKVNNRIIEPVSKGAMTLASNDNKNSFTFFAGTDPNNGGGVINDTLDLHAYQNGGWKSHVASFGNNGNSIIYENLAVGRDLTVSGNATINTNLNVNGEAAGFNTNSSYFGDLSKNSYVIHTPKDGRRVLYIAPRNTANTDWDWNNAMILDNNSNLYVGGAKVYALYSVCNAHQWVGNWDNKNFPEVKFKKNVWNYLTIHTDDVGYARAYFKIFITNDLRWYTEDNQTPRTNIVIFDNGDYKMHLNIIQSDPPSLNIFQAKGGNRGTAFGPIYVHI